MSWFLLSRPPKQPWLLSFLLFPSSTLNFYIRVYIMAHPTSYLSPLAYLCVLQRLQIETTFPTFLSTGVYKWFASTKQMDLQKIWEAAVSYLRWWPHTGDKVIWDTLGESSVSDNQKILLIHLSIYSLNHCSVVTRQPLCAKYFIRFWGYKDDSNSIVVLQKFTDWYNHSGKSLVIIY